MPPAPFNDRPGSGDRIANETDLIQTYLAPLTRGAPGAFGLRDDAALLSPEPGTDLVFTSDPIIAGVHFFAADRPADIAWKALAVNASDLAAKGARPLAYMLNLALPEAPDRDWMSAFAEGLKSAQESFGCHLIGGDTDLTPGPLSIGVTIVGAVPQGEFVRRQGAAIGDHVFVTGTIGDSALGLLVHGDPSALPALTAEERAFLAGRYLRPMPRLALGPPLRAYASAALDISDGLLKDLARLAGPLGLTLDFGLIPVSRAAASVLAQDPTLTQAVLGGGDDYELLMAVPPASVAAFQRGAETAGIPVHDLGALQENIPLRVLDSDGTPIEVSRFGYDHFSR
ncbi:thiamine-phosphate kinase [Hyphomicrobium sp.]|jgi:thiamine-monophosphate kinase|uniref:thiamine-phosphate kinase n=1 Tax=Hyphomicrobium sp. TaxID=82 RepID=UPI0035655AFB